MTGMKEHIEKINTPLPEKQAASQLYQDVCCLIENTRQRLATTVNAEACVMHWQIGKRIKFVYAVRIQSPEQIFRTRLNNEHLIIRKYKD